MTELRSEVAQDAVQQGILAWLLKRMRVSKRNKDHTMKFHFNRQM